MPIEGLWRTSSKSTLVASHPWLGLGVRRCSNITLLTHFDGIAVTVFSCQEEKVVYNLNIGESPLYCCPQ